MCVCVCGYIATSKIKISEDKSNREEREGLYKSEKEPDQVSNVDTEQYLWKQRNGAPVRLG